MACVHQCTVCGEFVTNKHICERCYCARLSDRLCRIKIFLSKHPNQALPIHLINEIVSEDYQDLVEYKAQRSREVEDQINRQLLESKRHDNASKQFRDNRPSYSDTPFSAIQDDGQLFINQVCGGS